MALYPITSALVDDNLPDNISELITAAKHREVEDSIILHVGASQVLVNPATTLNPGTPQNPVAYIALPGVYTNFINSLAAACEVTAPLGVLKWDGTSWEVTQLPFPSADNYFRAKTTAALSALTAYTTISISQSNGGWDALPGQWVRIVNRRTGVFEFVQLAAEMTNTDTSISIASYTTQNSYPIGSTIELFPTIGMRDWVGFPVVGEGVTFIDMDEDWRPPNAEAIDLIIYAEMLEITKNGFEMSYAATPTEEFHYRLDATTRTRIHFAAAYPLSAGEIVRVKCRQPAILYPVGP